MIFPHYLLAMTEIESGQAVVVTSSLSGLMWWADVGRGRVICRAPPTIIILSSRGWWMCEIERLCICNPCFISTDGALYHWTVAEEVAE